MILMRWRPPAPERCIKILKDQEPFWIGVITHAVPVGDRINLQCQTADVLLASLPLPFQPPGIGLADNPSGFLHWWRKLLYVFDLPNPSFFPPLASPLDAEALHVAERFVAVTRTLASSAVVSSNASITGSQEDDQSEMVTIGDFPRAESQAGFASFLRQCHGADEPAGYKRVHDILWLALRDNDPGRDTGLAFLRTWHGAAKRLDKRSLRQLMYDTFVDREGWRVFSDLQEKTSPEQLLKTFNYGAFLHWGDTRDRILSTDTAPFEAAHQQLDFLIAAVGLAHLYIGFGELVRSAITPPDRLLLPSNIA